MRMAEMLASVIAKVVFNKEKKNYEDAQKELEDAAKSIVGLDLKLITMFGTEDVVKLIKTTDIYGGRCLISAELLIQYADILFLKGNEFESSGLKVKALVLYIESILSKELPSPEDYYEKINRLITGIPDDDLTYEVKLRIFEYYEITGQYSKAEDTLFELIDTGEGDVIELGESFYNRLNLKSEEELAKGNFSYEEVEDGLKEIRSIKSSG